MKRPSFQFYPADWRNNAKLRRCSEAARGAWMDILCVLHDMDEYGVCRWPLSDLARASNISLKLVKELVQKEVLKGSDKDAEPYIYIPRHAGKDGEPVTLVENNGGPLWYCSRFVRDEYVRQRRGQSTRFDEDNQPPKDKPKSSPKGGIGEQKGDGSTSTSTSTSTSNLITSSEDITVSNVVPISSPTLSGEICKALVGLKLPPFNPANPKFLKLVEAGVTVEEFTLTAIEVKQKDPSKFNFDYLIAAVQGRRRDAAAMVVADKPQNNQVWYISASGIEAKAQEHGLDMRKHFTELKAEVFNIEKITDEMVRKANIDMGKRA